MGKKNRVKNKKNKGVQHQQQTQVPSAGNSDDDQGTIQIPAVNEAVVEANNDADPKNYPILEDNAPDANDAEDIVPREEPVVDDISPAAENNLDVKLDAAAESEEPRLVPQSDEEHMEQTQDGVLELPVVNTIQQPDSNSTEESQYEEDSKPAAIPTEEEIAAIDDVPLVPQSDEVHMEQTQDGVLELPAVNTIQQPDSNSTEESQYEEDSKPAAISTEEEIAAIDDVPAEHNDSENISALEPQTDEVNLEQNMHGVMGVPSVQTDVESPPEVFEVNAPLVDSIQLEEMERKPFALLSEEKDLPLQQQPHLSQPPLVAQGKEEEKEPSNVREQQMEEVFIEQNAEGVLGVPSVGTNFVQEWPAMVDQQPPSQQDTHMPTVWSPAIMEGDKMIPSEFHELDNEDTKLPANINPPPPGSNHFDSEAADEETGQARGTRLGEVNSTEVLAGAADEETGQARGTRLGAVNSTEVLAGAADKEGKAGTTNGSSNLQAERTPGAKHDEEEGKPNNPPTRAINPDFQDVQATGKWGTVSKTEMIIVAVVGLLALIGVIVALVVVLSGNDDSTQVITNAPTASATPVPAPERYSALIDALKLSKSMSGMGGVGGANALVESRYDNNPAVYEGLIGDDGECPHLPHECAMSWALYLDDFPPINNNITSRFAMADLYYSLGGNGWTNNTNWLSHKSYCEWYGIKCNRAQTAIQEIDLSDNNVVGEIPLELGVVDSVILILLNGNAITGRLPGGVFAGMPLLFGLYVQNNELTGFIPDNLLDNESLCK